MTWMCALGRRCSTYHHVVKVVAVRLALLAEDEEGDGEDKKETANTADDTTDNSARVCARVSQHSKAGTLPRHTHSTWSRPWKHPRS